jgi:D-alanyl-D-alanine carboxypeptidase (penicillin-binding protein 5/6)
MTAIVALEEGNLGDTVTVSKKAAQISGSSMDLKEGELLSLKDLLYGLLLNSGNDAAIAIAEHLGGSVEGFAEMMNDKAKELGALDSAFVTPHGLDADGHYTTAYDLAAMARHALSIPLFDRIVRTPYINIAGKNLRNTNEMLSLYSGADGVKTGFTGKAGRCLVASATRGGMRLISVVMGCPTKSKRTEASRKLLDFAFGSFKEYRLVNEGEEFGKIAVVKGITKNMKALAEYGVTLPLSGLEIESLKISVDLPESIMAPVEAGQKIGIVKYLINDYVLSEIPLLSESSVRKKNILDYINDVVRIWVGIMKGWSDNENVDSFGEY